MITTNPCGFVYNRCNGAPVRAEVSRLKNSKREYGMNSELPLIRLFCGSRYCYYKIRMILRNHSAYI